MRQFENQGVCSLNVGSVTGAMRAKKILASHSIRANVQKTSVKTANGGCVYAVAYSCFLDDQVRSILANAGI